MTPVPAGRRRCAVLGSPIEHSLSPVLHRAGYRAVGLDWSYAAHQVTESALPGFLAGLDDSWRGLSLTMPLKRVVVPLLDELSPRAAQAKAANTVILGGGRRLGHNTDITGAAAALRERWDGPLEHAVILGGGATATSVLLALADLGCRRVDLVARSPVARARATVEAAQRHPHPPAVRVFDFDEPPAGGDVLVSTIPAAAQSHSLLRLAGESSVVFDVVYDPWPTPLAVRASTTGAVLVSGLDLLVHQAVEQFTLMTGLPDAPLEAMREAGSRELAARARR